MLDRILAAVVTGVLLACLWQYLRSKTTEITPAMIGATLPWFGVVGTAYALQQGVALPGVLEPFIVSPTAYLTIGSTVLLLWITVDRIRPGSRTAVTWAGGILLLAGIGLVIVATQRQNESGVLLWNGLAILVAVVITALAWWPFRTAMTSDRTGWLGRSVVFAHVLDATTTGIGLEVLGTVERNPISAAIISAGDTVSIPGSGVIAFLLVKIVAALLLVSFTTGPQEIERETTVWLVVAGGVGLAPAIHNLVLFSLVVP